MLHRRKRYWEATLRDGRVLHVGGASEAEAWAALCARVEDVEAELVSWEPLGRALSFAA